MGTRAGGEDLHRSPPSPENRASPAGPTIGPPPRPGHLHVATPTSPPAVSRGEEPAFTGFPDAGADTVRGGGLG